MFISLVLVGTFNKLKECFKLIQHCLKTNSKKQNPYLLTLLLSARNTNLTIFFAYFRSRPRAQDLPARDVLDVALGFLEPLTGGALFIRL